MKRVQQSLLFVFLLNAFIMAGSGNLLDSDKLSIWQAVRMQEEPTYTLLTQPPRNLSCDPYANGPDSNLLIECSIVATGTQTESFEIIWHRILDSGGEQILNNMGGNQSTSGVKIDKYLLVPGCSESYFTVRSTLTVANVGRSNIAGQYWCELLETQHPQSADVSVLNENVQVLSLQVKNAYQTFNGCPENAIHASLGSTITTNSGSSSTSTPTSSSSSESSSDSSSVATSSFTTKGKGKPEEKTLPNTSATEVDALSDSLNQSFISFQQLVVATALIGVLFFAVISLSITVICLCCRRKSRAARRRKKESFQSTTSLFSSRETPTVPHQISPAMPSPPPQMTSALISSPNGSHSVLSNPPRHPPPRMRKLPPLQQHSTMPSRLSYQISSPGLPDESEIANIESRRAKRAATEQPSLNCLTGPLPIPPSIFAGTTGIEAQELLRQESCAKEEQDMDDSSNIYAAPFSDCASSITHSNSALGSNIRLNTIINTTLPTFADIDMDAIFADDEEKKYKSLNKYTMDDHPLYEDPSQACIDGEDGKDELSRGDEVNDTYTLCQPKPEDKHLNSALRYAKHLAAKERILDADVRESIDGEYVMPNEVIRQAADSSTKDDYDDEEEQPEYIIVS